MSTESDSTSVRIPKLAVREKSSTSVAHTDNPSEQGQSRPYAVANRPVSSGRDLVTLQQRPRRQTDASASSASSSGRQSQQPTKKKKGGVFGFLALKEPSSSAWDEYAAQQKKNIAAKGGRNTAVGMPGISSKKLPEHVPKVNSKWDGLPDEARKKAQQQKERDKRPSNISRLSGSTYQSYTSNSSSDGTASQGHRNGSSSSMLQSQTNSSGSQRTSTQTSRHQDLATAYGYGGIAPASTHPALRAGTPDAQSHDQSRLGTPASSLPDIPTLELPELLNFEAAAYITTSEEPSPSTPLVEDPLDSVYQAKSTIHSRSPSEGHDAAWPSDTETEGSNTEAGNHGPFADSSIISTYPARSSTDFDSETTSDESELQEDWPLRAPEPNSRPSPISIAGRSRSSTSTTGTALYTIDSSTAPTSTSPTFSRGPESDITRPTTAASGATVRCGKDLEPARSNSDASIAPSVTPSVMSAQWAMSPKERLGLGGKMRKSEVSPWEVEGAPAAVTGGDGKRASVISKKNRLSAILGRK